MSRKVQPAKAPYIPKGWLHNFLELIKRVKLQKINSQAVNQYELTAEGNESKLVAALRFLQIIDEDYQIYENKINPLKMDGENYTKALNMIIYEAYGELFKIIDLEHAKTTDLKNYFIGTYNYSQLQATGATIFFSYLCDLAKITVSEDIAKLNKKITLGKERKPLKKNTQNFKKNQNILQERNISRHTIEIKPSEISNNKEYIVIIRGKDFSINKTLRKKEDLNLLIKTLEINCIFDIQK